MLCVISGKRRSRDDEAPLVCLRVLIGVSVRACCEDVIGLSTCIHRGECACVL
jgi:hypothetical protein